MKTTHATIRVKVNTICPICDNWLDVADQFYGADDPEDPFIVMERKESYIVECDECHNEFEITEIEF